MAYTIDQIKVFAYRREQKPDFEIFEQDLFNGLAYLYDCYRAGYPKEDCEKLMNEYIFIFNQHQFYEQQVSEKTGKGKG